MATYKVGLSADKKIVHLAIGAALLPGGYTNLGTFELLDLTNPDHAVGSNDVTEVLFHKVQEVLSRTSWDDPTEDAIFPDNITDMSNLTIFKGWASRPFWITAPTLTGTLVVGDTLTFNNGTWTGPTTPTFAKRWFADNVVIPNAAGNTFVLTEDEIGAMITGELTATNAFGATVRITAARGPVLAE